MSVVAPAWWPTFQADPFPDAGSPGQYVHGLPKQTLASRALEVEPCGPWKLTEAELDAMDWALELDARAARSMFSPVSDDEIARVRECAHEDYSRVWGLARDSAAPGLVPVPTSGRMPRRLEKRADLSESVGAAMRELDAFFIDKEARRLAVLRRSVGFAARCNNVSERATLGEECLMVTLTYRGTNDDWQPRHIADFMKRVRRWLQSRDLACRYVWVAELQGRGVIHYHVALWVPAGVRLPMPDRPGVEWREAAGSTVGAEGPYLLLSDRPWWVHGMTRIEVARAAVPYLLKYLSKQTSKTFGRFPRGARIFGVGGLDHAHRRARRWLGLPAFVQGNSSIYDEWRRAPRDGMRRGGWLSPSGEHFASEFARVQVMGREALQRVCRHERRIEASGPFCWLEDRARVREVWAVSRANGGACATH